MSQSSQHPEVSIIIVNYNTKVLLLKCLATLFDNESAIQRYQIIVVDNDSKDGSADAIESAYGDRVEIVRSKQNLGFAAANNLAIDAYASGEWVILLNPDTEVLDNAISSLHQFALAHPDGGIYGGRTLFPDGSLNIASCWNDMTPWSLFCSASGLTNVFRYSALFDPEAIGGFRRDLVRKVDIVVGCLLLCKRTFWQELGGFDTSYWMYGEDTDLCIRARKLGASPMITPDSTIVHLVGASSNLRAEKFVMVYKARVTIIQRYWGRYSRLWGLAMLQTSVVTRLVGFRLLSVVSEKYSEKACFWRHLWSTRQEWLAGYPPKPEISR